LALPAAAGVLALVVVVVVEGELLSLLVVLDLSALPVLLSLEAAAGLSALAVFASPLVESFFAPFPPRESVL